MNAQEKDRALAEHIAANVVRVRLPKTGTDMDRSFATHNHMDVARTLRRAQLTLHRWAEEMCNGTIQRREPGATCTQCGHKMHGEQFAQAGTPCEKCGDPAPVRSRPKGPERWTSGDHKRGPRCLGLVPDRERGALARVEKVCKAAGLTWYYQRDPRGCALYVSAVPMTDTNYSQIGVPCI